jgi:hypothetical protein
MRVLFNDKARTAIITSLNESLSYPAANVADTFLDRPYLANTIDDVLTLDCGSDVDIDAVFIAQCTAAFVLLELTKANGLTAYMVTKNIRRPLETVYFASVKARYVKLTFTLANGLAAWLFSDRASATVKTIASGRDGVFPSGTGLCLRLPMDDLPVLPDGVAGTTWKKTSFASTDINLVGPTATQYSLFQNGVWSTGLSIQDSMLKLSIVTVSILRLGIATSSKQRVFRIFAPAATSGNINGDGTIYPITLNAGWNIVNQVFDGTGTTFTDLEGLAAGTYLMSYDYIGDGSYEAATKTLDTSPLGKQFTINTGAVRVPGRVGFAVDSTFGGLFNASEVGLPMGSSDRTISFELFLPALPAAAGFVLFYGTNTASQFVRVLVTTGGIVQITTGTGGTTSAPVAMPLGSWVPFCFTVIGGAVALYQDGARVATGSGTYATVASTGISIGRNAAAGQKFPGGIRNVQIWTVGLSASEILGLAVQRAPSHLATSTVVPPSGSVLNVVNDRFTTYNPTTGDYAYVYDASVSVNAKIKGIGFGDSEKFVGVNKEQVKKRSTTTSAVRSPGGQVMRNVGPVFREYTLTLPKLDSDAFRSLDDNLEALGTRNPTYWDINEETLDYEDPVYAEISEAYQPADQNQAQTITIPIVEAH